MSQIKKILVPESGDIILNSMESGYQESYPEFFIEAPCSKLQGIFEM